MHDQTFFYYFAYISIYSLDDDQSGTDIEEASDEEKEDNEEADSEEDGDAEAALTKQYQQEVEEDSDSGDDDDTMDPEKKKLAKEKVRREYWNVKINILEISLNHIIFYYS